MKKPNIVKVRLSDLVPHEQYREEHKEELKKELEEDGMQKRPIAIYSLESYLPGKYLIIDGHHRTEALKELGCEEIVANLVDYFEKDIRVLTWKAEKEWNKDVIIKRAIKGDLLEPKTTKHVLLINGKPYAFQDNDIVEPVVDQPLASLNDGH